MWWWWCLATESKSSSSYFLLTMTSFVEDVGQWINWQMKSQRTIYQKLSRSLNFGTEKSRSNYGLDLLKPSRNKKGRKSSFFTAGSWEKDIILVQLENIFALLILWCPHISRVFDLTCWKNLSSEKVIVW